MGRHGNGFGKKGYSDSELQFEGEGAKIQPWMILVFAGILVVVMLLCVLIWGLTHKEEQTAGNDAEESKEFSVSIDDEETEESEETESGTEESGSDENDAKESGEADTDANVAETEGTGEDESETDTDTSETEATSQEQDILEEPIAGDTSMSFTAVDETVTAKDVLNLRSAPTTADSENVVAQLKNGESTRRVGVNKDTGWSKLEYNGQTVYAVSRYLTTDLAYKPPVQKTNPNRVNTLDGRVIIFTDCDDYISPKNYVNLRLEPSTSEGNATVHARLNYGEVVHRTGYSDDAGWSRVEYNGQVVYVVTSYMITVTVE